LIIILIFSNYNLSGCAKNSYQNNDDYEYVKLSYYDVNKSLNHAINWFVSNIDENGLYNYIYDDDKSEYLIYNNIYHQIKNSLVIAELSRFNDTIKEIHKTNLEYIIDNFYKENNNNGFIVFENESELGLNAIVLRTILLSPFYEEYKEYSNRLVKTVLMMQNDNGSFQHDYLLNNTKKLDVFHSDKAIMSLIDMYMITGNKTYLNQSILSQNYFIKNYFIKPNEAYHATLIPGHTKSLSKLYDITNDDLYLSIVKVLNDLILDHQEKKDISSIGHFIDLIIDGKNFTNSSIDGYITESLAHLFEVLEYNESVNISKYKIGLILGNFNLINLQYDDNDEKTNGAIKSSKKNNQIRIDSTQNTIYAYLKILDVFGQDDWNYSYYPELNLLVNNKYESRLSNDEVWYALFYGTILSIVFIFLVYIIIRKRNI
jgi:hypothetical protein